MYLLNLKNIIKSITTLYFHEFPTSQYHSVAKIISNLIFYYKNYKRLAKEANEIILRAGLKGVSLWAGGVWLQSKLAARLINYRCSGRVR